MVMIDIPMPTDCYSCWIRRTIGCKIADANGLLKNKRDENCPLMNENRLLPEKPWHTKVQYADGSYWITDQCPVCYNNPDLGIWDTLINRFSPFCRRCGKAIDWSEYDGGKKEIDWDEYMSHVRERSKSRFEL